jgi:hypothetical protein
LIGWLVWVAWHCCLQMMMSPMLSPIRADGTVEGGVDDVSSSPEHGGVSANAESASLDEAIDTISSGDELEAIIGSGGGGAATRTGGGGMLTWPSPNGRIARTISEQIDSSPAAREFEAEMLRSEADDDAREGQHLVQAELLRSEADDATAAESHVNAAELEEERRQQASGAAAVRIQAAARGRQGRARAQQQRDHAAFASYLPSAQHEPEQEPEPEHEPEQEQPPQLPSTVVKALKHAPVEVVPQPEEAARSRDEQQDDAPPPAQEARSTRRQLQFDEGPGGAGLLSTHQLMVAVPQPGDDDDGTSPFSPSPFDGEHALLSAAGSRDSLLPPSAVAPPAAAAVAAPESYEAVAAAAASAAVLNGMETSEQLESGDGDGSTDSFSPSSAGPTPPKLHPASPFYSARDAVDAPAEVSYLRCFFSHDNVPA